MPFLRERIPTIITRSTRPLLLMAIWPMLLLGANAWAEDIGSVDTKFNLLSPDDSISVASFNDPSIDGLPDWY